MLDQRRRRWASIKTTLFRRLVPAGLVPHLVVGAYLMELVVCSSQLAESVVSPLLQVPVILEQSTPRLRRLPHVAVQRPLQQGQLRLHLPGRVHGGRRREGSGLSRGGWRGHRGGHTALMSRTAGHCQKQKYLLASPCYY